MNGKIEPNTKRIKLLAKELTKAYQPCFCKESTEHWVRMYAAKRWETINYVQTDDYDNPLNDKLKKVFIDTFTEGMCEYIHQLNQNFNKKEKEYIQKHGVRRKPNKSK